MNHDGIGDMCQCDLPRPGRCVRGGGKKKRDCLVEFNYPGDKVPQQEGTRREERHPLHDGDPLCDLDGKADGQCTFGVTICLGVPDEVLSQVHAVGGGHARGA
jgi:hypothetical protein